jgi:hypothetical protein
MKNNDLQELTEEQKQKILKVLNNIFSEYHTEESSDSEYITEYDILMKQKEEEFKLYCLQNNNITSLIKICDTILEEKPRKSSFWFRIWLNNDV